MNTPSSATTECASKLNRFTRENPTQSLIFAIGCGLAAGLLIRALQPRPIESRATRLLEEIQDRLHSIAAPVRRNADRLVESGTSTVRDGVEHFHDLHLDRSLQKLGGRIRNLFR